MTAVAAIFFPVALVIGSVEIYRKVKFNYNSTLLAGVAAFFGSLIPIVSIYSYYLGLSRTYSGQSIADNAVLTMRTPKIASTTLNSPRSGHISLPTTPKSTTTTLQPTQIGTCINTRYVEEEKRLYIDTKPNSLYFDSNGDFFLKSQNPEQPNIGFSKHAAEFMQRVLKLIRKPTDLTIDMSRLPFISIRIKQISGETQYFISPKITNNENLLFCPNTENGHTLKLVLPIQFARNSTSNEDTNLQTLLYPQEYATPKHRRDSDDNLTIESATPTTSQRRKSFSM